MKKYFQSILSFLFIFSMPFIIHQGMNLYQDPLNFIENPLVWFVIVFYGLVVFFKEITMFHALEKARKLQLEKEGLAYEKPEFFAWWREFLKYWTISTPKEEVEIILDHDYDGIRELDNSLPPWWKNLFYITIVFAVIYLGKYHIFDGETQKEEYNAQVALAEKEIAKYKEATPDTFDLENTPLLVGESELARGKAVFNLNCASCHASDGGGGIGPNLTDEYWILGGGYKNVVNTLLKGGRAGKGMVSWNKTLKPEDIAKVASYVISMQGTTPKKPKAVQGEIWTDNSLEEE